MKKRFLIIAAMLVAGFSTSAQEQDYPTQFSLNEAVDYAIEYNRTLKTSKMDVEYKRKQITQAISQGLPQINTTLDYSTNFGYEMNFGGNAIKLEDQLAFTASASQLLFSGQWIVGVQTAKIARQISELGVDATDLEIRSTVHTLYYTILAYQRMGAILENNLADMEVIRQHTENMYAQGVVEVTDVDQIRVTVNQLRNNLYSVQRNTEVNSNILKIQMGLPVNSQITLTDNIDNMISSEEYSELVAEQFDINQNISYKQMITQEKLQEKMVSIEKWSFAPTISARYSYLEKIVEPSFSMSPSHSGAINLSFPIFSGLSRKSSLEMQKINMDKIRLNRAQLEDNLNMQEIQYKFNLRNAIENYQLQKSNLEVSEKVLTNYRNKYDQGVISSLELTQANTNFLNAQTNYTTAVLTLLNAQVELQKLHNSL
ncbi:MAG: TolC family protein [Bacteroidales bacterium]|nr:TolC family protein [Bacteroidales bacterium]